MVIVSKDERGREYVEHFVRWGESLWKIAGYERFYADSTRWREIYETNKDEIDDPNLIFPKQVLRVPRTVEEKTFRLP